ncbi:hypothetical protein KCU65_g169, partial [Aureobasidium melanogenum]
LLLDHLISRSRVYQGRIQCLRLQSAEDLHWLTPASSSPPLSWPEAPAGPNGVAVGSATGAGAGAANTELSRPAAARKEVPVLMSNTTNTPRPLGYTSLRSVGTDRAFKQESTLNRFQKFKRGMMSKKIQSYLSK